MSIADSVDCIETEHFYQLDLVFFVEQAIVAASWDGTGSTGSDPVAQSQK